MTDTSTVDLTPLASELDTLRKRVRLYERALKAVGGIGEKGRAIQYSEDKVDVMHYRESWAAFYTEFTVPYDGTIPGLAAAIVDVATQLGIKVPE